MKPELKHEILGKITKMAQSAKWPDEMKNKILREVGEGILKGSSGDKDEDKPTEKGGEDQHKDKDKPVEGGDKPAEGDMVAKKEEE